MDFFGLDWKAILLPSVSPVEIVLRGTLVYLSLFLLLRLVLKEGRFLHRNMRQEMVTEGELMSFLRQQGVDDPGQVKEAYMEGDGRISVIPYEGRPAGAPGRRVS